MLFLNIWGSSDPFSHNMIFLRSMNSGDYKDRDIEQMYARYVADYNAKRFSCLSAILVDIDCVNNQVTTKQNFRQAWPLKEKKIINTNAMEVRAKRLANPSPKIKIVPPQDWGTLQAVLDEVAVFQPNPLLGGNAQ